MWTRYPQTHHLPSVALPGRQRMTERGHGPDSPGHGALAGMCAAPRRVGWRNRSLSARRAYHPASDAGRVAQRRRRTRMYGVWEGDLPSPTGMAGAAGLLAEDGSPNGSADDAKRKGAHTRRPAAFPGARLREARSGSAHVLIPRRSRLGYTWPVRLSSPGANARRPCAPTLHRYQASDGAMLSMDRLSSHTQRIHTPSIGR